MDSLGVDPSPVSANGDTAALPPAPPPPKELLRGGAGAFQMLPPAEAPDVGGPLSVRTRGQWSADHRTTRGRRSRVDRVSWKGWLAAGLRQFVRKNAVRTIRTTRRRWCRYPRLRSHEAPSLRLLRRMSCAGAILECEGQPSPLRRPATARDSFEWSQACSCA